ncbi:MAG: hypothetical protein FWG66_11445 [Spirochaetes bacterium]|nr:hypothetical protein [Spirochaetota bacterium]
MSKKKSYKVLVGGQQKSFVFSPAEPCEYHVVAASPDEAQQRALSVYQGANPDAVNTSASVKKNRNIKLAIVFTSIACFLSFIGWWTDAGSFISLAPNLMSVMAAIALYSAVMIRSRGLANSFNTALETVQSILMILLCASFVNFFIGTLAFQIPLPGGLFQRLFGTPDDVTVTIPSTFILLAAIMLSWLGVPQIAKYAWIALFIIAGFMLLTVHEAMGGWGAVYMLSAFLGIVFMLKHESADTLNAITRNLSNLSSSGQGFFKTNLDFAPKKQVLSEVESGSDSYSESYSDSEVPSEPVRKTRGNPRKTETD